MLVSGRDKKISRREKRAFLATAYDRERSPIESHLFRPSKRQRLPVVILPPTVRVLYYPTRLEELQTWLLDEDACKTEWQTLLDLRARHAPRHAQYRMIRPLSARRPLKGSASEGTQH
jgi:hypothetical protein